MNLTLTIVHFVLDDVVRVIAECVKEQQSPVHRLHLVQGHRHVAVSSMVAESDLGHLPSQWVQAS